MFANETFAIIYTISLWTNRCIKFAATITRCKKEDCSNIQVIFDAIVCRIFYSTTGTKTIHFSNYL